VSDHHQHALDDDRLQDVQPLVALASGELDGAQHAERAWCLDEDAGVNLVGLGPRPDEVDARGAVVGRCGLLNSMERAGKKAVQRRVFDNDFPTP